jgi:acetyl-CoA acyltransferase
VNVNNNWSTGSSALYMARQAVRGGLADCALALGVEKMEPGSLGIKYTIARTRSTATRWRCSS